MVEQIKDPILKAVQDYMDGNLYKGFTEPFILERLIRDRSISRVRPYANAFIAELKGFEEEDLSEFDRPWLEGLARVGQEFTIELRLPSNYFEK